MTAKIAAINFFALLLFGLDRIIKKFFFNHPDFNWGDFFYGNLKFNFVANKGIAFGVPLPSVVLVILLSVVVFFLVYYLQQAYIKKNIFEIFCITFILTGAVSNIIDRITYSVVVDYINVPFFTVFNIADIMISAGIMILLSGSIKVFKK